MEESPRFDERVEVVANWLKQNERLSLVAEALRDAIDYVLDGAHTGRYDVDSLDKIEKTFIGLKAEHFILHGLELKHAKQKGSMDTLVEGIPVDIKFSLSSNWMIPQEAMGQICLLCSADDHNSFYSVGIFCAEDSSLAKPNRDGKRSILKQAREGSVLWVCRDSPLPRNILLHIGADDRKAIFSLSTGQKRVREFFRRVRDVPIPKKVLSTVAQQDEPRARARDAAKILVHEGLFVYTHLKNKYAEALGLPPMRPGWWMAGSFDPERFADSGIPAAD